MATKEVSRVLILREDVDDNGNKEILCGVLGLPDWSMRQRLRLSFVGGKLDPGETPLEAAQREANEEVCINNGEGYIQVDPTQITEITNEGLITHVFYGWAVPKKIESSKLVPDPVDDGPPGHLLWLDLATLMMLVGRKVPVTTTEGTLGTVKLNVFAFAGVLVLKKILRYLAVKEILPLQITNRYVKGRHYLYRYRQRPSRRTKTSHGRDFGPRSLSVLS